MRYKTIEYLRSKAMQFSPKLATRVREETKLKKMLDEYHSVECKSPEAPTTKTPPQAVQGMWQAYGTIRGAMIRGWFSIAATGVIGTGLFLYRLILSDQKKEIKLKQDELNRLEEQNKTFEIQIKEKDEQVNNREKALDIRQKTIDNKVIKDQEYQQSYIRMFKLLETADQYVAELCDHDERCISEYSNRKHIVSQLNIENIEYEALHRKM